MFVHYNTAPIVGGWVVPWDELPAELRAVAGHEGRVHEPTAYRNQWRSDRAHIMQLADETLIFSVGTGYADRNHWIYEVEPIGPLEPDPEVQGHYLSRLCVRARVVRCLHDPTASRIG